jgi:hypothetical protein
VTSSLEDMNEREELIAEVVRCAAALTVRGTLVFRNGDDGQQLPFNGTAERTAYAFVGDVEDHDNLRDALDQFEQHGKR